MGRERGAVSEECGLIDRAVARARLEMAVRAIVSSDG